MITSRDNARVKRVCAYQGKKKERDADGVFIAEGERLVTEAPADALVELYVTASYRDGATGDAKRFLAAHEEIAETVSDDVMRKMSDVETPQGVLAVVKQRTDATWDLLTHFDAGGGAAAPENKRNNDNFDTKERGAKTETPLLILTENIQDTGNLGTILRSCEAAGATGVILAGDAVDLFHPKVVRATMGAIFRMPFLRVKNVTEAAAQLKSRGVKLYAADMAGEIVYDEADLTAPACFIIGNEANGLSDDARMAADETVCIPMAGRSESLNAAVSASLLVFEAARQRRGKGAR